MTENCESKHVLIYTYWLLIDIRRSLVMIRLRLQYYSLNDNLLNARYNLLIWSFPPCNGGWMMYSEVSRYCPYIINGYVINWSIIFKIKSIILINFPLILYKSCGIDILPIDREFLHALFFYEGVKIKYLIVWFANFAKFFYGV
jgi:hypothetical protein